MLAIAALLVVFGLPIFMIIFLQTNRFEVRNDDFRKKFGEMFEKYRYKDNNRYVLLEPFVSLTRRLVLAVSFVFLSHLKYFGLFSANFQMTFVVIFNGMVTPFGTKKDLFIEQYNEVFVAFLIYHIICFADLVTDPYTKNMLGFSMIGVMSLAILTGFSIMAFSIISSLVNYCKLKKQRTRNRIAMERQAKINAERKRIL